MLETIDFPIAFHYHYVNDIVTAVLPSYIDMLLNRFNTIHSRLKFTIEVGGNKINFLDTTILIYNKKIKFDWFHKPTFSGRYLNFLSQHLLSQKRGVMDMIDRSFFLITPWLPTEKSKINCEYLIKQWLSTKIYFQNYKIKIEKFGLQS